MTNKKLSRLLEPNLKLYFLCMVVFAIATAWVDVLLGLVQLCAIGGLYVYFARSGKKRRQGILFDVPLCGKSSIHSKFHSYRIADNLGQY